MDSMILLWIVPPHGSLIYPPVEKKASIRLLRLGFKELRCRKWEGKCRSTAENRFSLQEILVQKNNWVILGDVCFFWWGWYIPCLLYIGTTFFFACHNLSAPVLFGIPPIRGHFNSQVGWDGDEGCCWSGLVGCKNAQLFFFQDDDGCCLNKTENWKTLKTQMEAIFEWFLEKNVSGFCSGLIIICLPTKSWSHGKWLNCDKRSMNT